MKYINWWLGILFSLFITNSYADSLTTLPAHAFWITNPTSAHGKPINWRSPSEYSPALKINNTGLKRLFISGSAQPNQANLLWIHQQYGQKHKVYVLDLRQETHLYINGAPKSIFYKKDQINWGKKTTDINLIEHAWVQKLSKKNKMTMNRLGKPHQGLKKSKSPHTQNVSEVYTEADAAQKARLGYFKINVPDYHPPSPQQVDQFLGVLKSLPVNAWVHLHCAAGKGRTTTFMVLFDILANSKQVRLTDIIKRQALIGGIDLFANSDSLTTQPWKEEYHLARVNFLHLFYEYVHSNAAASETFTQWMDKQPVGLYKSLLKTDAYTHTEGSARF